MHSTHHSRPLTNNDVIIQYISINLFLFHVSTCPSLLLTILSPYALLIVIIISSSLSSSLLYGQAPKQHTTILHLNNSIFTLQLVTVVLLPLSLIFWSGCSTPLIFGHLFLNSLSIKLSVIFYCVGLLIIAMIRKIFVYLRRVSVDLNIFLSLFVYFTPLLFFSNSLISFVFIIEFLTTQIFILILLWDTVNRDLNVSNITIVNSRYRSYQTPLEALFFFFWTSFIIAVFFFFTLDMLIGIYALSDWAFFEFIVNFTLNATTYTNELPLVFLFSSLFAILMLKTALVPFFFWKPSFFAALHIPALLLYIVFFFSLLISWIVIFWFSLNNVLTSLILIPLMTLLGLGSVVIISILYDSTAVRNLLAISSIFNTLLIWLTFSFCGGAAITLF